MENSLTDNLRCDRKNEEDFQVDLEEKPIAEVRKLDWRKETSETLMKFKEMDVILVCDITRMHFQVILI